MEPALHLAVALYQFTSGHSLSCVRLFETPWAAALQVSLSITNFQSLLKLMSIESVMPCNHLILCRPLLLPPSLFPYTTLFRSGTTEDEMVGWRHGLNGHEFE